MTNVRWSIEFLWRFFNECSLDSNGCRDYDSDVAIVVVIDRAHRKDTLANEKRGLAVREFLRRFRQAQTYLAYTLDMLRLGKLGSL